jgi:hypothetical protein
LNTPNSPDEPRFDIIAFEAAAKARAAEFAGQAARLAAFRVEEASAEWLEVTGAQYELSDGSQVAVQHEIWEHDPDKVVAKVRIMQPFVESLGIDRNLRRVQLTRFIMYMSFLDGPDEEQLAVLDEGLSPRPDLDELGRAFFKSLEQARMEDRLDPDFRPGELIWARTSTLVECKLPNGPNFRTERELPNMPADTRLARTAARRNAGEPVVDPAYDIAEHSAVIALLNSIDTAVMEPQPLDPYFDETWLDPEPNLRSWWPREQ